VYAFTKPVLTRNKILMSNKLVTAAVRSALLASAVAAAGFPVYVAAQSAETELEEVVVTGSLIPQDLNAPGVPVTLMTADQIDSSGVSGDMLDVLNKTQPFFYGGLNIGSDNGNVASGSTNGGSQLALRNRSTLVLINGRRAAVSPVAASGGFNFVDVSMIPVSAVERVEILADGASATYGADAVGGVVNLIMKSNYDGVEFGGRYGLDQHGEYEEQNAYVTMGTSTERTNVTFSAEWKKSDPLIQADRKWGQGIFRTNSFAGSIFDHTSEEDAIYYHLDPSLNAPDGSLSVPITTPEAAGYSGPLDTNAFYFDLAEKPTMLIGAERKSAVLAWDHEINESVELFGDFLLSNTNTWSQLNAQPVGGVVTADNPFNPFNQDVFVSNRFVDFPREYETDTTGWRTVFGVRGDITGSWKYEVAGDWNYATSNHRNPGLIDTNAYNTAVACEPDGPCYNPFARQQDPGVLEGFQGEAFEQYVSSLYAYDAKIYGEIFQLPAGAVQLALGAAHAEERLKFDNDRNSREGLWLQATPTQPFDANSQRQGYYAEVRVPITSPDFNLPGLYAMEVSLGGRYEVFDTTDEEPFVPKFTMRWQPFGDTFAIRGSYSESFTAPTLYELFGPTGQGFTSSLSLNRYDSSGNPTGATDTPTQYRSQSGSNTDLNPSESTNYSVGFEWTPDGAMQGLQIGVDYWSIEEEDIVDVLPSSIVLQSVEALGPNSPYASYVRRGVSAAGETYFGTGTAISAPGEISGSAGDTVWLSNSLINLASIEQDGLDVRVGYSYDTESIGTFSGQLTTTLLFNYDALPIPTEPLIPLAGTYHDDYGLFPDYRAFLQLGWAMGGFTVGVNAQYLPEGDDVTSQAPPYATFDSYMSWDLRAGYDFTDTGFPLKVSGGVNNVFDEEPVFIESEGNQSRDISNYDPIGQFYYVELSYKF
jgi:iron complex outermembrane receptor protein